MTISSLIKTVELFISITVFTTVLCPLNVMGEGLLRVRNGAVLEGHHAVKEFEPNLARALRREYCGVQEMEFDIGEYRDEEIEVVLSTSDTSDTNINKAKRQTEKSLQKAFRQFMINSDTFAKKLSNGADIRSFEAPEKERIRFDEPDTDTSRNEITVLYKTMPTFPTTFFYNDCEDIDGNDADDTEEDVADALTESIKQETDRLTDYFETDLKENNWDFSSLKVKK